MMMITMMMMMCVCLRQGLMNMYYNYDNISNWTVFEHMVDCCSKLVEDLRPQHFNLTRKAVGRRARLELALCFHRLPPPTSSTAPPMRGCVASLSNTSPASTPLR